MRNPVTTNTYICGPRITMKRVVVTFLVVLVLAAAIPVGIATGRFFSAVGTRVHRWDMRAETTVAYIPIDVRDLAGKGQRIGKITGERGGLRHLGSIQRAVRKRTLVTRWPALSLGRRWRVYQSPALADVRKWTRILLASAGALLLATTIKVSSLRFMRVFKFPFLLWLTYKRLKPSDSMGTAQWASRKTLASFRPVKGESNFVVGDLAEGRGVGQLVSIPEQLQREMILVNGPTGSRKTNSQVIPNLLGETGKRSVIVTDPKGDVLGKTYDYIHEVYGGKVHVLDFYDRHMSARYNPIANAHTTTHIFQLADTLVTNTGISEKDPFWHKSNIHCIAAVLSHLQATEPDAPLVAPANFLSNQSVPQIIECLAEGPSPLAQRYARAQLYPMSKNDKLIGSVMTELIGRWEFLLEDSIRATTGGNDLDLASFGTEPQALYIRLHVDRSNYIKPLSACLWTDLFRILIEQAKARPTKELAVPVFAYMDEFANMGVIPAFANLLTTVRGHNMGAALIVQSLSQIRALYQQDAAAIIGNCNTKVCLAGAQGDDAVEFSRLAGKTTVITSSQNASRDSWDLLRDHAGISRQETSRDLITADEIRTMEGKALLIPPRSPAVLVRQRPYYEVRGLSKLVPDLAKVDVEGRLRAKRPCPLPDPGMEGYIPSPDEQQMARHDANRYRDEAEAIAGYGGIEMDAQCSGDETVATVHTPSAEVESAKTITKLTPEQIRVVRMWLAGESMKGIASGISKPVAETNAVVSTIRQALGITAMGSEGRAQLEERAAQLGIVPQVNHTPTPSERVALEMIAGGLTPEQMSRPMKMSPQDVRKEIARLRSKFPDTERGQEAEER